MLLARIRSGAIDFVEHWAIHLVRSSNDITEFADPAPGISIEVHMPLDGGVTAPQAGLKDLGRCGGKARIGCVGFNLPLTGKVIDEVLTGAQDAEQPLFSGDEHWRIWPLDIAMNADEISSMEEPGDDFTTYVARREIPIRRDGLYPVTFSARVFASDADWHEYLENQERRKARDESVEDVNAVAERIVRSFNAPVPSRSEFNLVLQLAVRVRPGMARESVRLSRLSIVWPPGLEAVDMDFPTDGERGNAAAGVRYDPATRTLELGDIRAISMTFDGWAVFKPVLIRISSPMILRDMPSLKGNLEFEIDELMCGLVPIASDWQGLIVDNVRGRTRISAKIEIVLADLFRMQPYTTQARLHLVGVDIDELRLSMIAPLLRDMRFEVNNPVALSSEGNMRRYFISASRLESGDWLVVDLLVRTRLSQFLVERKGTAGQVSSQLEGGDTTIDIRGILRGSAAQAGRAVNAIQRRLRERLGALGDREGGAS